MTPTRRILTAAGIVGTVIAGGVLGASLSGPLSAAANGYINSGNSGTLRLTAASATPSAGTFKSNETPSHEATESATREAQENSGQAPFGGTGKFTPNESASHEAGESAAREAQENAGQVPTVP